jgi:hypothetical protein
VIVLIAVALSTSLTARDFEPSFIEPLAALFFSLRDADHRLRTPDFLFCDARGSHGTAHIKTAIAKLVGWRQARTGMVVAECGTGKTLISLGAIHVHSEVKPFTALAMVPPHLVEKWWLVHKQALLSSRWFSCYRVAQALRHCST